MVEKYAKVTNTSGLHAKPAALFVQTAGKFTSSIWITKDNVRVNAKSIMGLMSLGLSQGTEVLISAEGEDEHSAIKELVDLISSGCKE
jgi:phosphocarrier protein